MAAKRLSSSSSPPRRRFPTPPLPPPSPFPFLATHPKMQSAHLTRPVFTAHRGDYIVLYNGVYCNECLMERHNRENKRVCLRASDLRPPVPPGVSSSSILPTLLRPRRCLLPYPTSHILHRAAALCENAALNSLSLALPSRCSGCTCPRYARKLLRNVVLGAKVRSRRN